MTAFMGAPDVAGLGPLIIDRQKKIVLPNPLASGQFLILSFRYRRYLERDPLHAGN
ncbi:hypothetical protein [Burkholderia glumae]|uniref:hypothetical protein n=1 Tax=Burkholderia glumae TaxID=337 RepID=UPI001C2555A2|nr:hypothetical protein [Burkholderia glumae]